MNHLDTTISCRRLPPGVGLEVLMQQQHTLLHGALSRDLDVMFGEAWTALPFLEDFDLLSEDSVASMEAELKLDHGVLGCTAPSPMAEAKDSGTSVAQVPCAFGASCWLTQYPVDMSAYEATATAAPAPAVAPAANAAAPAADSNAPISWVSSAEHQSVHGASAAAATSAIPVPATPCSRASPAMAPVRRTVAVERQTSALAVERQATAVAVERQSSAVVAVSRKSSGETGASGLEGGAAGSGGGTRKRKRVAGEGRSEQDGPGEDAVAVKKARRMAANRASAARSRERQLQVQHDLEATVAELTQDNKRLRMQLAAANARLEAAGAADVAEGVMHEVGAAVNGRALPGMKRRRDDAEEEEQRPAKCCCRTVL